MQKTYLTYKQIHKNIEAASKKIIESGFDPDFILAIGGGGLIPARIIRTFIKKPIISISVAYYD